MNDYEMGRLAEELIEKRYADRIKDYEDKAKKKQKEINKLNGEIFKLKHERCYLEYSSYSGFAYDPSFDPYTYVEIDAITKDLRDTKKDLKEVEKKSFKLKSNFNSLPWYKKMMFVFKGEDDEN